jgi:hypothetical protein
MVPARLCLGWRHLPDNALEIRILPKQTILSIKFRIGDNFVVDRPSCMRRFHFVPIQPVGNKREFGANGSWHGRCLVTLRRFGEILFREIVGVGCYGMRVLNASCSNSCLMKLKIN